MREFSSWRMRYGINNEYNRTSGIVGYAIDGFLHESATSISEDLARQCNDLKLLRDWEITTATYQEWYKGTTIPNREDLEDTIQWFEKVSMTWRDISDNI